MNIDLAALPDDVATLQGMVRTLAAERTNLTAAQAEIERLRLIVAKLQRSQFGRRAERLDDDQLQLGFEDLGADIARAEATLPSAAVKIPRARARTDRTSLPPHLPREDMRFDVGHQTCPCCGGPLHAIGETISEMLDHVPARLRVIRVCRPRYGCRACGTIHQAPPPERPIAKGLASPGLLAHVLVAKYCDHLPLYRQSQIFARQGVELDRSTLANWVGGAVWWLEPLQARLAKHVFASQILFADDTPIPVLDPGRGRTKTGRLWVYARDDRPWNGPDPPAVIYLYSPDRRAERPASHLAQFRGVVQVDGYPGFERLRTGGNIELAACWAHARRKFYEVHDATGSPVAAEALRRIAELYAIEATIRGRTAEIRQRVRRTKSLPVVEATKIWLEAELNRIPPRGGLADAIRYALTRWSALGGFLDDGRIELDTNTVERAIRPIALGRKNHLFAGSDEGASCCSSHHVIDRSSRFCWRSSGGGRRDRRALAWPRISSRSRSASRIIQGAPLQCWLAGRAPSAMRRRMVVVLRARAVAASFSVTSPRSARSPSR
jgi:transposase